MLSIPLVIPEQIRGQRILVRRWQPGDADSLKQAIDESLAGLKAWVPWGAAEPSPLSVVRERLEKFEREFGQDGSWGFGVFSTSENRLLGGIGLHGRIGPTAVEIGYWVRASGAGRGIATEAVQLLTTVAMAAGVSHVEIHCDPGNKASARVAAKAGFRHAETRERNYTLMGGDPRDTMVWVWPADAHPFRAAAAEP